MQSNNVLILGPPHSGKIRIAQLITKDLDTTNIVQNSHSGLTYTHKLRTKYFSLDVNLLIEEYPDSRLSDDSYVALLRSFYAEFRQTEFLELRDALDGLIFTLDVTISARDITQTLDLYEKIKELLDCHDVFLVVVGDALEVQKLIALRAEDEAISRGFEYVNLQEQGTNEFNEKIGRDRIVEILETHEWPQSDTVMSDDAFTKSQTSKLESMASKLIDGDHGEPNEVNHIQVDLDFLLAKLKADKDRVQGMSEKEKKTFVDDLVDNYMEYF